MRFLLGRTDGIGDVMVSLPVMERIHSRMPEADVHWLVSERTALLFHGLIDSSQLHLRENISNLIEYFSNLNPDAFLNLGHRDAQALQAARKAGIPIRVARARGSQILDATQRIWKGRSGTGRHEAMHALDFLSPWGWQGGWPTPPRLALSEAERCRGEADLSQILRPRVGIVLRGSGAGAHPSNLWWENAFLALRAAGWNPVVLAPVEEVTYTDRTLRGLMSRIAACEAIIAPSTGPIHLAAALDIPVLALMGKRPAHGPDRWAPLGRQVQILQYPGPEADLMDGMDRLDPAELLPHLDRFR